MIVQRPMPLEQRRASALLLACLGALFLSQSLPPVSAQQPALPPAAAPPPATTPVGTLHVQRAVYMLVGAAGNSAVQIGEDGPLVVDAQPETVVTPFRAAIRSLSPKPIHTIVDTHVLDDRTGGDEALIKVRGTGASQQVRVIAHEAVLSRLVSGAAAANRPVGGIALNQVISLPINNTYTSPGRDFYLNGESVVLYHAPAAHSDGDTIVHFRTSDVLAVGDLFWPDTYPVIDVAKGGSANGLIAALNRILELTVPAKYQEGGTYVIPGKGRLSDEADVVEYRDMVTIVRDRIGSLIKQGRTLDQVKAARPSSDYDPEFGGAGASSPDAFVEAIYRSVGGK